MGERPRYDGAVLIDTDVQLPPSWTGLARTVFPRSPLALTRDLQARRIDDQLQGTALVSS